MTGDDSELTSLPKGLKRRVWFRRIGLVLPVAMVIAGIALVPWAPTLKESQVEVIRGARSVLVGPGTKDWVRIEDTSRHVIHAFLVAEDDRYYDHFGLDVHEIAASLKENISRGFYARGASTITQQVIKIVLLSREKTILRKAREAVGALWLERIMHKDKILEWYLNLVELGHGVYGIRAAARHYFATEPRLLTISQAAHLALILPSPHGWSQGLRRSRLTEFGHQRFASIIHRMRRKGYITQSQWTQALATGDFGNPVGGFHPTSPSKPQAKTKSTLGSRMESKEWISAELDAIDGSSPDHDAPEQTADQETAP